MINELYDYIIREVIENNPLFYLHFLLGISVEDLQQHAQEMVDQITWEKHEREIESYQKILEKVMEA